MSSRATLPAPATTKQTEQRAASLEFTPRTIETTVGKNVTGRLSTTTPSASTCRRTRQSSSSTKGELGFNAGLDEAAGGWPGAPDRPDEPRADRHRR